MNAGRYPGPGPVRAGGAPPRGSEARGRCGRARPGVAPVQGAWRPPPRSRLLVSRRPRSAPPGRQPPLEAGGDLGSGAPEPARPAPTRGPDPGRRSPRGGPNAPGSSVTPAVRSRPAARAPLRQARPGLPPTLMRFRTPLPSSVCTSRSRSSVSSSATAAAAVTAILLLQDNRPSRANGQRRRRRRRARGPDHAPGTGARSPPSRLGGASGPL